MVGCLFVWPALWMFADVGTPHAIAVNEQVADMGSLVAQGRAKDLDLPGVIAAPDAEYHPSPREDVRRGIVLGQA